MLASTPPPPTHNIDSSNGNENTPDAVVIEEDKHTKNEQRENEYEINSKYDQYSTLYRTQYERV